MERAVCHLWLIIIKGCVCVSLSSVCPSVMAVVRFYSDEVVDWRALQRAAKLHPQLSVTTELCYNVELTGEHEAPEVSKEADTPPSDHDRLSVLPRCLSVRPTPPCRLQQSQCRAEGRSPLVVSPAAAGRAAVRDAEADGGQRGEAGGDRTQVPLDPGSLTTGAPSALFLLPVTFI